MDFFKQTYKIVGADIDITYHVSPNAILLYFQDCFANFLSSKRLAAFDIIKDNLLWVITHFNLSFTAQRAVWSENIDVEIWIREISSARVFVNYRIKNHDNLIIAEGSSCWVIINAQTKRPINIKNLLEQVGIRPYEADVCQCRIGPSNSNPVFFKEISHQVNITDLDFNGHMCNRSYLSVAMATAPVEFIHKYVPKHIQIKFIREAFLEDELKCLVYKMENIPVFHHKLINAQGEAVCTIISEWILRDDHAEHDISQIIRRD